MVDQPLGDEGEMDRALREIARLMQEIEQCSRQDVPPPTYYQQVLPRAVQALAALGGGVWSRRPDGSWELTEQTNFRELVPTNGAPKTAAHDQLLRSVVERGRPWAEPPQSATDDPRRPGNPTPHLLLLAPVRVDHEIAALWEIVQRPNPQRSVQEGYLKFLTQVSAYTGAFLSRRGRRGLEQRQSLWNQLEQFNRLVYDSLDSREVAYILANEARRLIGCDRVSIALRSGPRFKIKAVSGQETVESRSNQVQRLGALATRVAAAGDAIWYQGELGKLPREIETPLQAYLDEAHCRLVVVEPLRRPVREAATPTPVERPEVVGVMIVEQIEDTTPAEQIRERLAVVTEHGSRALAKACEHEAVFLLPLWRALGHSRVVVKARHLPKTALAAGVLVAIGLALWLIPWRFSLEGRGTLEPVNRREIFASLDGSVEEIFVRMGQDVAAGDRLLAMRNTDLEVQITDLIGQQTATQEQLVSIQRLKFDELPEEERTRLEGQRAELRQRAASLQKQLELLYDKRSRLQVTSPLAGQVATDWRSLEMLDHRPVQLGQALMTVVDPRGPWELEVRMPEDRMGHLVEAARRMAPQPLQVTFHLATDPGVEHRGTIREIELAAEVRGDEGNTVLVRVDLDRDRLPQLRPGAEVRARVDCGRRSLGYVLFHQIYEWFQAQVLFRFF